MPVPTYEALMLPVLRGAATGPRRIPELAEDVASELGLTLEEREALLPSGRQRLLHNRLHWAKFYMTKAGLIEAPQRGVFTASAAGRTLLAQNPIKIDNAVLLGYPAFQAFVQAQKGGQGEVAAAESLPQADDLTPEEKIDQSAKALERIVRSDLMDRVSKGTPEFFEALIVDLLVAMGYGGSHADTAKRIGRSGDGGVDGVISEDRLGLDRIYVQAKRYAVGNTVGRPDIQTFVGSLVGFGATKGVFVTTSTFSQQARDYAKHLSQRVVLIDGGELATLMIEHSVGVRTARTLALKRVDEDYFNDGD